MSESNTHQQFSDSVSEERVLNAGVLEVLSTRNGKVVELVGDKVGKFVRRTYSPRWILEEVGVALDFEGAWEGYNSLLAGAELKTVPSILLASPNNRPIIVTEYIGQLDRTNKVKGQPLEAKVNLARRLGKLLTSSPDYLPDAQGFSSDDAFVLHPDSGELRVLDVDPYLRPRHSSLGSYLGNARVSAVTSVFLEKIGLNIREWAEDDEERTQMARAFVGTAGLALDDNTEMSVIEAFSDIHFMAQGLAPTDYGSFRK